MNKKIIIIIGAAVVVALVIGLVVWFSGGSSANPGPSSGSSGGGISVATTTPAPPTPTGNTITIGTSEGSVTVNNFYANGAQVTSDGKTAVINESSSYSIAYNTDDSSFSISLLSTPLSAARQAAESAFLNSTGISQTDACKLKVTVEVPVDVDPSNAGIDFGLSFCPGAVATP